MEKKGRKVGSLVGGLGILAATAVLCVKGLKKVEGRLKKKPAAEETIPEKQPEE